VVPHQAFDDLFTVCGGIGHMPNLSSTSPMHCLCQDERCRRINDGRKAFPLYMTQALRDAKFLTYTYSWDFSHTLSNPPDDTTAPTIGEILKSKAEGGPYPGCTLSAVPH